MLLPLVVLPLLRLGDALRSEPLRLISAEVKQREPAAPVLIALGDPKPSLHFYTERALLYEGLDDQGLVNVADRLRNDPRVQIARSKQRALVVAPLELEQSRPWSRLLSPLIQQQGRYGLWWLDLQRLAHSAEALQQDQGLRPIWSAPRPERF